MTDKSDTPMTDAQIESLPDNDVAALRVMTRFARQLEHANAELREAAEALITYEETGAPLYLHWDEKFEALKAALEGK